MQLEKREVNKMDTTLARLWPEGGFQATAQLRRTETQPWSVSWVDEKEIRIEGCLEFAWQSNKRQCYTVKKC